MEEDLQAESILPQDWTNQSVNDTNEEENVEGDELADDRMEEEEDVIDNLLHSFHSSVPSKCEKFEGLKLKS